MHRAQNHDTTSSLYARRKVSDHQHKVSDHQHKVSDHQHKVSDHQHKVSDHQHKVSDHQHKVSDHQHKVSDHQHRLQGLGGAQQPHLRSARSAATVVNSVVSSSRTRSSVDAPVDDEDRPWALATLAVSTAMRSCFSSD
jgi:hypothetical protein